MAKLSGRLVGGAAVALTLIAIGVGVMSANANVAIVPTRDDSDPSTDAGALNVDPAPLTSFAPTVDGAPTWSAVTYASSAGECFDLNAEWSGAVVGSLGGCGFGEDVDSVLRLLTLGEATVDTNAILSSADVKTPFLLAAGHVASPIEAQAFFVVAGIANCDCLVTARWSDGIVASAKAVDGFFMVQREPIAFPDLVDADEVPTLDFVEVTEKA